MSSHQAWTRTGPLDPALSRGLRLRALESHEESRELARELAEDLGQRLALVSLKLAELQEPEEGKRGNAAALSEAAEIVRDAASRVARLAFRLSPSVLFELDFGAALEVLGADLAERDGLELDLCRARDSDLVPGLDDADLLACFRGAREVLLALAAGSPRPRARLRVLRDAEQVVLEIRSRAAGTAFLPQADALADLRARLAEMGVELVVAERAGEDRHIQVAVPLRHRHDREGSDS